MVGKICQHHSINLASMNPAHLAFFLIVTVAAPAFAAPSYPEKYHQAK